MGERREQACVGLRGAYCYLQDGVKRVWVGTTKGTFPDTTQLFRVSFQI